MFPRLFISISNFLNLTIKVKEISRMQMVVKQVRYIPSQVEGEGYL